MKTEIKNYNANKFTKEIEHLIIRNGYRILSVQSGGLNGDTEVIVLTKAEDIHKLIIASDCYSNDMSPSTSTKMNTMHGMLTK